MRNLARLGLVLVAVLLFCPPPAAACKSCSVPAFWNPDCLAPGCTYCVACDGCCGGDPNAGGHCELYCNGPARASTTGIPEPVESLLFVDDVPASSPLATPTASGCPATIW